MYDISIIGAGAVGLATAFKLLKKRPSLRLCVIEKEKDVSLHQSGRNSGVIHSGIYYKPGSLKATNNIKGYQELLQFCKTHGVEYEVCGKVIVAKHEEEMPSLLRILENGKANGLEGLRLMEAEEINELEPHVKAFKAIKVPQTGITDFKKVSDKIAELIREQQVEIVLGQEVKNLEKDGKSIILSTDTGEFRSRLVVNCAGLYADKIARKSGFHVNYKILPFRGEYYQLEEHSKFLVKNLIYPVPDLKFPFLGVHFTRMINGEIEAGPNAVLAFRREGYSNTDFHLAEFVESITYPGFLLLAGKYFSKGIDEMHRSFSKKAFHRNLSQLIPELKIEDIKKSRSGVRAQAVDQKGQLIYDYFILENESFVHLCNAPSPAATSCLSIGDYLASTALAKL